MAAADRSSVSDQIEIRRTPPEVFGFLTDLANWRKLDDALVALSPESGLSLGASGTATHRRVLGLRVTTSWEVIEFAPGARLTIRIRGRGYELTEDVRLDPATSGTLVDVTDRLAATSLSGRLMVPLSGGIIRRDLHKRLSKLKATLEAAPGSG